MLLFFSANIHVSQPGSSLKLFGDSRKQNTKWVMRPWKHLIKGDSQERKPNNILAYFICYASTESSELVQPSASTPLLHQQEAAVAGKQGQQLLEEISECTRTTTCITLAYMYFSMPVDGLEKPHTQQRYGNNWKKNIKIKDMGKNFFKLANLLLNQRAQNRDAFCNLRASERCRPGNIIKQSLRESNHLLAFCGVAGVPIPS